LNGLAFIPARPSPVPGFQRWLTKRLASTSDPAAALLARIETGAGRLDTPKIDDSLKPLITRFCAAYLMRHASTQEPADPVAHFHLGNGARLERINWLGNTAPRRIKESFGIMVNYLYDIETIESNHEAFVNDGTVMRSADVDALLAAGHISAPNSGQPESEEATGGLQSNFTNSNVPSSQLKLSH
jgi:malonyl-CoA decarboxylase